MRTAKKTTKVFTTAASERFRASAPMENNQLRGMDYVNLRKSGANPLSWANVVPIDTTTVEVWQSQAGTTCRPRQATRTLFPDRRRSVELLGVRCRPAWSLRVACSPVKEDPGRRWRPVTRLIDDEISRQGKRGRSGTPALIVQRAGLSWADTRRKVSATALAPPAAPSEPFRPLAAGRPRRQRCLLPRVPHRNGRTRTAATWRLAPL